MIKRAFISFSFFLFVQGQLFAQLDQFGNPIFNSIELSKDEYAEFTLVCNYYTIDRNISNQKSSVYLGSTPSLPEYIRFARTLPTYFFLVKQNDSVMFSILMNQKWEGVETKFTFTVFDPASKRRVELPCKTWGEITELRMAEMNALKFDTNARMLDLPTGKVFQFDGVGYRVQPYFPLKDEVVSLAKDLVEKAQKAQQALDAYVLKESVGGKMDFSIALIDEPNNKLFLMDGIAFSKKDYLVYLWAQASKELGIDSMKRAVALWEQAYQVKLKKDELAAFKKGFTAKKG